MTIKLPLWLLRRLVKRHPWLLSKSGTVSRPLVFGILFWELTIDTAWALSDDERERLILERDAGML
ncbi:hypothetical protein [Caulobacter sp.]|uniref:hypothetical protein n=1 Tax=Caulobacter sp. TaxID=78 RepID=UPI003BA8B8A9